MTRPAPLPFDARNPVLLAETAITEVFRVELPDGRQAALKRYKGGSMRNEETGVALLRAGDPPLVPVWEVSDDAVLMPLVEGSPLGDMFRGGDPDGADAMLAKVALALRPAMPRIPGLPELGDWFSALFDLSFAPDCPATFRQDMTRAAALARDLIATTEAPRPLHGDLHHDNVILSAEGPVAIDPKGVLGDPGFELANAMRNPRGGSAELREGARIAARTARWSEALGVPEPRFTRWAAAKCALSIAWRAEGPLSADAEADLLSLFLARVDQ